MAVGSSKMRWPKSQAVSEPAPATSDAKEVTAILTAFRMGQAMANPSVAGAGTCSNASEREPRLPPPPVTSGQEGSQPLALLALEACGFKFRSCIHLP